MNKSFDMAFNKLDCSSFQVLDGGFYSGGNDTPSTLLAKGAFYRASMSASATSTSVGPRSSCLPASSRAQTVPVPVGLNTTMGVAGNRVPIVDIVTSNRRGVSLNTYAQFNVCTNGLILNNSGATVVSQLRSCILGNPSLVLSGPASLIVNEVTSVAPSVLDGCMEVAGAPAVVVANRGHGALCVL